MTLCKQSLLYFIERHKKAPSRETLFLNYKNMIDCTNEFIGI